MRLNEIRLQTILNLSSSWTHKQKNKTAVPRGCKKKTSQIKRMKSNVDGAKRRGQIEEEAHVYNADREDCASANQWEDAHRREGSPQWARVFCSAQCILNFIHGTWRARARVRKCYIRYVRWMKIALYIQPSCLQTSTVDTICVRTSAGASNSRNSPVGRPTNLIVLINAVAAPSRICPARARTIPLKDALSAVQSWIKVHR